MTAVGDQLRRLVTAEVQLRGVGEARASAIPSSGHWTRKEILGHLIDSAANNHQRFVRLQLAAAVEFPGYAQDAWVRAQNCQSVSWNDLVDLWVAYNRHLSHVVDQIMPEAAGHVWKSPDGDLTLEFLVKDYVRHTQHHLRQILAG